MRTRNQKYLYKEQKGGSQSFLDPDFQKRDQSPTTQFKLSELLRQSRDDKDQKLTSHQRRIQNSFLSKETKETGRSKSRSPHKHKPQSPKTMGERKSLASLDKKEDEATWVDWFMCHSCSCTEQEGSKELTTAQRKPLPMLPPPDFQNEHRKLSIKSEKRLKEKDTEQQAQNNIPQQADPITTPTDLKRHDKQNNLSSERRKREDLLPTNQVVVSGVPQEMLSKQTSQTTSGGGQTKSILYQKGRRGAAGNKSKGQKNSGAEGGLQQTSSTTNPNNLAQKSKLQGIFTTEPSSSINSLKKTAGLGVKVDEPAATHIINAIDPNQNREHPALVQVPHLEPLLDDSKSASIQESDMDEGRNDALGKGGERPYKSSEATSDKNVRENEETEFLEMPPNENDFEKPKNEEQKVNNTNTASKTRAARANEDQKILIDQKETFNEADSYQSMESDAFDEQKGVYLAQEKPQIAQPNQIQEAQLQQLTPKKDIDRVEQDLGVPEVDPDQVHKTPSQRSEYSSEISPNDMDEHLSDPELAAHELLSDLKKDNEEAPPAELTNLAQNQQIQPEQSGEIHDISASNNADKNQNGPQDGVIYAEETSVGITIPDEGGEEFGQDQLLSQQEAIDQIGAGLNIIASNTDQQSHMTILGQNKLEKFPDLSVRSEQRQTETLTRETPKLSTNTQQFNKNFAFGNNEKSKEQLTPNGKISRAKKLVVYDDVTDDLEEFQNIEKMVATQVLMQQKDSQEKLPNIQENAQKDQNVQKFVNCETQTPPQEISQKPKHIQIVDLEPETISPPSIFPPNIAKRQSEILSIEVVNVNSSTNADQKHNRRATQVEYYQEEENIVETSTKDQKSAKNNDVSKGNGQSKQLFTFGRAKEEKCDKKSAQKKEPPLKVDQAQNTDPSTQYGPLNQLDFQVQSEKFSPNKNQYQVSCAQDKHYAVSQPQINEDHVSHLESMLMRENSKQSLLSGGSLGRRSRSKKVKSEISMTSEEARMLSAKLARKAIKNIEQTKAIDTIYETGSEKSQKSKENHLTGENNLRQLQNAIRQNKRQKKQQQALLATFSKEVKNDKEVQERVQQEENNRFLNQVRIGSDIYSETSHSEIDHDDFCEINNRNTLNISQPSSKLIHKKLTKQPSAIVEVTEPNSVKKPSPEGKSSKQSRIAPNTQSILEQISVGELQNWQENHQNDKNWSSLKTQQITHQHNLHQDLTEKLRNQDEAIRGKSLKSGQAQSKNSQNYPKTTTQMPSLEELQQFIHFSEQRLQQTEAEKKKRQFLMEIIRVEELKRKSQKLNARSHSYYRNLVDQFYRDNKEMMQDGEITFVPSRSYSPPKKRVKIKETGFFDHNPIATIRMSQSKLHQTQTTSTNMNAFRQPSPLASPKGKVIRKVVKVPGQDQLAGAGGGSSTSGQRQLSAARSRNYSANEKSLASKREKSYKINDGRISPRISKTRSQSVMGLRESKRKISKIQQQNQQAQTQHLANYNKDGTMTNLIIPTYNRQTLTNKKSPKNTQQQSLQQTQYITKVPNVLVTAIDLSPVAKKRTASKLRAAKRASNNNGGVNVVGDMNTHTEALFSRNRNFSDTGPFQSAQIISNREKTNSFYGQKPPRVVVATPATQATKVKYDTRLRGGETQQIQSKNNQDSSSKQQQFIGTFYQGRATSRGRRSPSAISRNYDTSMGNTSRTALGGSKKRTRNLRNSTLFMPTRSSQAKQIQNRI